MKHLILGLTLLTSLSAFDTWEHIHPRNSGTTMLPSTDISEMVLTDDDDIWLFPRDNTPPVIYNETSGWYAFEDPLFYTASLADYPVYNALITKEGKCWAIYGGGLLHFDGAVWCEIDNSGDPFLKYESFSTLHELSNGDILASTSKGVVRYSSNQWERVSDENLGSILHFENESDIWFFKDGGATRYLNGEQIFFDSTNSNLPSRYINSMAKDCTGVYWFAAHSGVYSFDGDTTWNHYSKENSDLPYNKVTEVQVDSENRKWFIPYFKENWMGVLTSFDGNSWETYARAHTELSNPVSKELPDVAISELLIDKNDTKWVRGNSLGIIKLFKDGTWEILANDDGGLPSKNVRALIQDRDQRTWVVTDKGVAFTKGTGWELLEESFNELSYTNVNNIIDTSNGSVWIGQYECRADSEVLNHDSLRYVTALAGRSDGSLLAFREHQKSLLEYRDNQWSQLPIPDSLIDNDEIAVKTLMEASDSSIWIGTIRDGVLRYKSGEWSRHDSLVYGTKSNYIEDITEDSYGAIWVLTSNKGILRYGNGEWNSMDECPVDAYYVSDIESLPDSSVVLATSQGLVQWKAGEWFTFTCENSPLPINGISSCRQGVDNSLLLGTSQGLVIASKDKPTAVVSEGVQKQEQLSLKQSAAGIEIAVPGSNRAVVTIFDVQGREVFRSSVYNIKGGRHTVALTEPLASGIYLVVLDDVRQKISQKMLLR